jgi:hypothetical protein
MKKLRLDIEVLRVQSFATHATESRGGTVRGHGSIEADPSAMIGCDPYAPTSTGCSTNPPASEVGPSCYPGCTLIEH